MIQLVYVIFLLSTASCAEWGVVISEKNLIDFLYPDGGNASVLQGSDSKVTAIAYDPIYENLYYLDIPNDSVTHIRMVEVTSQANVSRPYTVLSLDASTSYFFGLAHDPVTSSLFWTTIDHPPRSGQIWMASLGKSVSHELLGSFKGHRPRAIAVDSCRGYIYWVNSDVKTFSIDRMRLSDRHHEPLLSGQQILIPSSLAISQSQKKLYWVQGDNLGNSHYITRADLDGGNVEEFMKVPNDYVPQSLAVTHEAIYFTDSMKGSLLMVRLNDSSRAVQTLKENVGSPQGIAVRNQLAFIKEDKQSCSPLADLRNKVLPRKNITKCLYGDGMLPVKGIDCSCWAGYSGLHCEVDLCHNYCLHGGQCTISNGAPSCICPSTNTGVRCELESCSGTCLNGGTVVCNESETSQYRCLCPEGFYGPSCETPSFLCNIYCKYGERSMIPNVLNCPCSLNESLVPPRYSTYLAFGLICTVVIICLLITGLLIQTRRLKSRPRIFKRYSVTPRPVTSPSCEIAIENCCNMNICETPCYEVDLRTVEKDRKISKKEEKRGLLKNDELEQTSSCRSIPDF